MYLNESQVKALDQSKLLDTIFAIPLTYTPNTHFTYSNLEPYLLSVFFQENFHIGIDEYINNHIFKPLGIKTYIWKKLGNYCVGATGLYLKHKDFHKIGKLIFNYGKYNHKQIISEQWIKEMTKPQVHCPDYYKPEKLLPKFNAGYFTWISRDGIVFRDGSNGQYIICDYNQQQLITIMSSQNDMNLVTECLRGLI